MSCKCGHQLKDHQWNFEKYTPQPCNECECKDFFNNELDIFFPEFISNKDVIYYRAICLYNGVVDKICSNNDHSLCITKLYERPRNHYHLWDGKNAWKCPCG